MVCLTHLACLLSRARTAVALQHVTLTSRGSLSPVLTQDARWFHARRRPAWMLNLGLDVNLHLGLGLDVNLDLDLDLDLRVVLFPIAL